MISFWQFILHQRYWIVLVGLWGVGWVLLLTRGPLHKIGHNWSVSLHQIVSAPAWWWQRMRHLEEENQRLKQLLERKLESERQSVISYSGLSIVQVRWDPMRLILVGRSDSLSDPFPLHQGVLGPRGGAVGIIMAASPPYYFIETIFSNHFEWIVSLHNFSAPVDWRSADQFLQIREVPQSVPIHRGDTVFIHPRLGTFPPYTPMGIVYTMQSLGEQGTVQLTIKPVEDIAQLRTVFVPHIKDQAQIDSLVSTMTLIGRNQ